MESMMPFLQERWFVIAGGLIVLFLVIKIVKTVLKWALVLAILAGIVFYGASYTEQIKEVGGRLLDDAKAAAYEEAVKALAGQGAVYKQNEDGSFSIAKGNVTLEGRAGSNEVKIGYGGQAITVNVDDALLALIEQAKTSGGGTP